MSFTMPQAHSSSFADRPVVLVTGAAKRLGKAIAMELAGHGWRVAAHYHHSAAQAEQTELELASCLSEFLKLEPSAADSDKPFLAARFCADLAKPQACETLFGQVLNHFGRVDAVVNSASQFVHDDARSFDADLAQAHFATNCIAPIRLARCLHEHIASRNTGEPSLDKKLVRGAVVNLLDQKLWNLNPDFLSYTLSKAALQTATTMMAQSLAPLLRVCAVAPGLSLPSYLQDAAQFDKAHRVSPLGRSSDADDVARTVRFVLENESMTGSQVLVDGGQHLMHLPRDISFLGTSE